jgi:hypothetical protein
MITRLPDIVLAGLYKDSLVITHEQLQNRTITPQQVTNKKNTEVLKEQPPIKKWFLGDNRKNILILLKDTSAIHINDEWLGTLSKLLNACNLNLADVAIINQIKQARTFTELKEELRPQFVFMFNVLTADIQLSFTIPHYQVQNYGGCTFMTAPIITLSAENSLEIKTEKRKLWEKLRMIFNV